MDRAEQPLDPVVAAYLKDVDRTLLRSNLRLSPEDRVRKLQDFVRFACELREAGRRAKQCEESGRQDAE